MDKPEDKKTFRKQFWNFYYKNYKRLLIIPIVLFLLAIIQISYQTATTGDFINRDVSLKGGTVITIPYENEINVVELDTFLSSKFPPQNDVAVKTIREFGKNKALIIETDLEGKQSDVDTIIAEVESKLNVKLEENYTVEIMGSSLGKSFFREVFIALLLAFIFMSIVVFIVFRVTVPCLAVIIAALSDIIITVAVVNLLGMKISTAGIAAFLMLIGYSVDTDILLTTRVLKRKEGELEDKVKSAVKTGMTMTLTTIIALIVAIVFTKSEIISQIMTILLIGLIIDIFNTWITNVTILRMYVERKMGKHETKA